MINPINTRLHRDFFHRPTVEVAQTLLGKVLIWGEHRAYITETEAYRGEDDPACHAARGRTVRNAPMYGSAGHTYVYFIYGMYNMLNIVTEAEGFPAAVLIRALTPLTPAKGKLDGPGKLCRTLDITTRHSGLDMITSPEYYVADSAWKPGFTATPRIGIKVGTDKLWRFVAS